MRITLASWAVVVLIVVWAFRHDLTDGQVVLVAALALALGYALGRITTPPEPPAPGRSSV